MYTNQLELMMAITVCFLVSPDVVWRLLPGGLDPVFARAPVGRRKQEVADSGRAAHHRHCPSAAERRYTRTHLPNCKGYVHLQ
jgi:hypothetical protein